MTKKLTLVADGVPVATPTDLGASGAELWRAITSEYDIADIGGRTLLAQLCKAHNHAGKLQSGNRTRRRARRYPRRFKRTSADPGPSFKTAHSFAERS